MAWPPESLGIETEDLINQCELMEVLPASAQGKQFVPVVELAALLYTGEYVHARHLWRRWKDTNPPSYLADWWAVGAAMMALSFGSSSSNNNNNNTQPASTPTTTTTMTSIAELTATIWNGLAHIQATHPAPLQNYATEVGIAYRKRVLQRCHRQKQQQQELPPPQPYWTLLNFTSTAEWELFCQHHGQGGTSGSSHSGMAASNTTLAMDAKTSLTQVVAFLESKPPSANTTSASARA